MMKKIRKLSILAITLSFSFLSIGCSPETINSTEDTYQPIDLVEVEGELTGDDPEVMALALFGNQEAVEGNFSQETEVIEKDGFNQTVLLTQMNLPDDSVKGLRYRLNFEFDQSIGQWRLQEVGRQQSCYRGDSPDSWTIEPCP
ncbi:unknown [Crocosphaera subtropica ATCC 51142]|uniref:Uncharacterized protein n=1 Tax=Crocosphaera subtropica (strain ATCC 51142 / BH68) TaxID=43989 RepID=B1WVR3_CROS5|nr:hypothetical protein [Crocosphaera subtropica]ACB50650.1 unknown [Crocosphaera subtropica ATCC 51142]